MYIYANDLSINMNIIVFFAGKLGKTRGHIKKKKPYSKK